MMMMIKHLKTYSKGFQLFNSQGRQRLKRQEISLCTEVMMQAGQDLKHPYYQMELLMRSVRGVSTLMQLHHILPDWLDFVQFR